MKDDTLWGYYAYRLTGEDFEKFLTAAADEERHIYGISYDGKSLLFRTGLADLTWVRETAERLELEAEVTSSGGLPVMLYRRRYRYGIAAGILLTVFFILFMSLFVYDISVTGNTTLYEEDILSVLADNGLYVGVPANSVDCSGLRLSLMKAFDCISYAIVNIKGSYAEVEITERGLPPSLPVKTPCNIIAAEDGQIVRFETYRGEAVSARGKGVVKGELLVSGVLDSKYIGYRTVHAAALVMARTKQTLTLTQPYSDVRSELSGNTETVYTLRICGLDFAFGKKESEFEEYITETETSRLTLGGSVLPVSVTKCLRKEISGTPVTYTEEEAGDRLLRQINELERIAFRGLETEARSQEFTDNGDGLTLTVTYTVIKNIAAEQELYTALRE